jgi:hypothetical protein
MCVSISFAHDLFRKAGAHFFRIMRLGNKKAPDLLRCGASDQDDASFDYARTPPEPLEGLVLVVALVVAKIMAPSLWGSIDVSSIAFARKSVKAGLIWTYRLRDKPLS